jgi:alanine racemase
MVDVTNLTVKESDSVEIIGVNQTLDKLAESLQTIPYEVLTSISKRVHRVYLE